MECGSHDLSIVTNVPSDEGCSQLGRLCICGAGDIWDISVPSQFLWKHKTASKKQKTKNKTKTPFKIPKSFIKSSMQIKLKLNFEIDYHRHDE